MLWFLFLNRNKSKWDLGIMPKSEFQNKTVQNKAMQMENLAVNLQHERIKNESTSRMHHH